MNKFLFLAGCSLIVFACASPRYLTYEKFGAKGDGVTDDLPAIIATHAAANEKGLPVKATGGKTYYIGNTIGTAVIRTDVDFGTADPEIKNRFSHRAKAIAKLESFLKNG